MHWAGIFIILLILGFIYIINNNTYNQIIKLIKKNSRFFLDVIWYVFIILFLGQLGPIIGYAVAFWDGQDIIAEINKSAGKADLITCATAILAGGTFFLVKEYNSSDQINKRGIKSLLILLASIIGLGCIGIAAKLLAKNGFSTETQEYLHWTFYTLAVVMAFVLWVFEEMQGTAKQAIEKVADDSNKLTEQSKNNSAIDGVTL